MQQLPIPEPLRGTLPYDAHVALRDAWKSIQDRIAALEAIVRDLQARVPLNSTNSSKPPSSDPNGRRAGRRSRRLGGGAAGNPTIAMRSAPCSLSRRSARAPTASPMRAGGAARRWRAPTRLPLIHRVAESAPDRADLRRIPAASPHLSGLRDEDLHRLAQGGLDWPLQPVHPGGAGHPGGRLPTQQRAGTYSTTWRPASRRLGGDRQSPPSRRQLYRSPRSPDLSGRIP
jgi:hypothetical protein